MLALAGVRVGDAETDEASAGVELFEPCGDGEAEVGMRGVEVREVGRVVAVGEEEVANDLVGHQAAQDFHPHRRRPFLSALMSSASGAVVPLVDPEAKAEEAAVST